MQAGQQAQRHTARTQEDLSRALQRLDKDLQGALQHRRETEKHNQARRTLQVLSLFTLHLGCGTCVMLRVCV